MNRPFDQARFYINDEGPVTGSLKIDPNTQWMWSEGPQPDPNWSFTDSQGHWHARSVDENEPYPTLTSWPEDVPCDGSCGGICGGEGSTRTVYSCAICGEEIQPGTISGPYQFPVQGLKEWQVEVDTPMVIRYVNGEAKVTVRAEIQGKVFFGVAIVVEVRMDPDGLGGSRLMGTGPLGERKAQARAESAA